MSDNLLPIQGFGALPGSAPVGYPTPDKELTLTLTLRNKLATASTPRLDSLLTQPPHLRRYLTHEELTDATGAFPEDIKAIEAYFQRFNIKPTTSALLSTVTLTGSAADFATAFHTEFALFQANDAAGPALRPTGTGALPAQLLPLVQRIASSQDDIRKEWRQPTRPNPTRPALQASINTLKGYTPTTLAKAYHFPQGLAGSGQVIGIIELTGAGPNHPDLDQYFSQVGVQKPEIVEVGTPPTDSTYETEMTLDLEVAGGLAPQARLVIYYGNTLAEALRGVVSDEVNRPSIVSISWGGAEANYTAAEVQVLNLLFYQAAMLGITLVAGSADQGGLNGLGVPSVSLPASSPLVLGCGGTTATINSNGILTNEVVWYEVAENDPTRYLSTGGGYSDVYAQPYYQGLAVANYPYQKRPARGIPDLAADASLDPGYQVVFNGQSTTNGGTSAAAPLVAALLALLSEKLGYRLGFLNPVLYAFAGSPAFRPITQGNNGVYAAAPYWNPCTGLGSPVGTQLLALLQQLEQAGPAGPPPPAPPPSPKDK